MSESTVPDDRKVTVLVVDDQLDAEMPNDARRAVYEAWLKNVELLLRGRWRFQPYFCGSILDVASVESVSGQPRVAIVDMVLEGTWTSRNVEQLDRKLSGEKWPLLLVSARFDSPQAISRANKLLGEDSNDVPFQFLMWSAIQRAVDGIDANELAFIVNALLSRDQGQDLRFNKGGDDPIDILHITDAHFGKASWDVGALMSLRRSREKAGLAPADFVAITGDIADRGRPDQYVLAAKYLQGLANNQIVVREDGGLPRDRVIVCPGNHDFVRPIALAANVVQGKEHSVATALQTGAEWMREYAWAPYERFESDISDHACRWLSDPGYAINTRFASSGLIFLRVNVERYGIDGYQEGFSDAHFQGTFNAAVTALNDVRKPGDCVVVLAHRHESDVWKDLTRIVDSSLKGLGLNGPVIVLCGHEHSSEIAPRLDSRVIYVRGIPPVQGPTLPALVMPMLNSVRLIRGSGRIVGVEVHQFHQHATGWTQLADDGVRYDYAGGRWRLASD